MGENQSFQCKKGKDTKRKIIYSKGKYEIIRYAINPNTNRLMWPIKRQRPSFLDNKNKSNKFCKHGKLLKQKGTESLEMKEWNISGKCTPEQRQESNLTR